MISCRSIAAVACSALLLAACSSSSGAPPSGPSGPTNFVLDGVTFHISSGGFFRNVGAPITMYLTDQVDTCAAVTAIPKGVSPQGWMRLELAVSPPTDGTTNVVILPALLLPGQAAGAFIQQFEDQTPYLLQLTTLSGNLSWFANPDATITMTELKVAFQGTSDTVDTYNLTIVPCN